MKRSTLLTPTNWLRVESFLSRLDLAGPPQDFSQTGLQDVVREQAAVAQNSITLPSSVLELPLEWIHHPDIHILGGRLRVQVQSGKEFLDFRSTALKDWLSAGHGVDYLADRLPAGIEFDFVREHSSQITLVYCENVFFPINSDVMRALDERAPGWKIWFAPRSRSEDPLWGARDVHHWLKTNPQREKQVLIYELPNGRPLCAQAPLYFHDFQTDPLDLAGAALVKRWFVRSVLTPFRPGFVSQASYSLIEFLGQPWYRNLYSHVWRRFIVGKVVMSFFWGMVLQRWLHGYLWRDWIVARIYWRLGRGFLWGRFRLWITYPMRKIFWFCRYQYYTRIQPRVWRGEG